MCESSVYLLDRQDRQQLLMEEAVLVQPENGTVLLMNILGEKRQVAARIERVDLLKHRILLRSNQD